MPDRKPKKAKSWKAWFRSPIFKVALAVLLVGFITISATFTYFYVQYSRIIDRKLSGEVFKNTAKIYATPYRIYSGQKLTTEVVVMWGAASNVAAAFVIPATGPVSTAMKRVDLDSGERGPSGTSG